MNPFRTLVRAAALGLVACLAVPVDAATLRVPADYPTIQQAVFAAASVGDTIEVSPGVYDEDINVSGKTLQIVGLGETPGAVSIDASPGLPAIRVQGGASLTLRNVRVTGADVTGFGGGIDVVDAALLLEDAVIEGNAAGNAAGIVAQESVVTIRRTLVADNSGGPSSGTAYFLNSTTLIEDSLFQGNEGNIGVSGGQITIRRVRIWDTTLPENFAVLTPVLDADVEVSNSVIDGNTGSSFVSNFGASVQLVNVTVANNDFSVARLSDGPGEVALVNSIVTGDPALPMNESGPLIASYSLVPGGGVSGLGIVEAAPIWKPLSFFELDAGSPGIDAADSSVVSADPDFLSQPRFVDDGNIADSGTGPLAYLDMGAIERRTTIRYVDDSATGTGDGLGWENAMTDLQDAFDAAAAGVAEEIWVAAGVYRPDRGTGDRTASFEMRNELLVLGGFAGSEQLRADRDPSVFNTILSGAIGSPDSITDNTLHVVQAEEVGPTGVLSGFIIQRGVANLDSVQGDGGGIRIIGGAPVIDDVVVRQCQAARFGSAIFVQDASPLLNRVQVNRNGWASEPSGTVVVDGGAPVILNMQINGNRNANLAALQMRQLTGAKLANLTIWGNETDGATAGIDIRPGSEAEVVSSIVWGNVPANPLPGQSLDKDNATGLDTRARYTTVEGWPEFGDGNDGREPGFVDADGPDGNPGTADDDLRLAAGSPLIDAGDNTGLPPFVNLDLAGMARFVDDPSTPDSGVGPGPIVDRGAYEFEGTPILCPADVDGDGTVGFSDVLEVLSAWGACTGCPADIDGGGTVDFDDLLTVLAAWGPCPQG